jgi:hypothetical protein
MKSKILGMLAVVLLAGPASSQAAVIGTGQYQDWVFDLSAYVPLTVSQGYYSAIGEDPLAVGASIGFSVGSAVGLSDLGTGIFTNNEFDPVDNVGASLFGSVDVPDGVDSLFVRVSYVDDAFGFDNFQIYVTKSQHVDGVQLAGPGLVPLPAAAWLLLSGLGRLGLLGRRSKSA